MSFTDYADRLSELKGIALEGGGTAGIAHYGVIQVLEEKGILENLTHFAGSSVGALVAGIMACRISVEDMGTIFRNLNLRDFEDSSWFVIKDMYRLWNEFGWNKGNALEKWYGDLLKTYIGNSEITFQQVYERFGSFLIVTGTDVGYRRTVYYNPETAPDMPIKKAIRESVSIPFFYRPCRHDDNIFVDGGVLDNYPIQQLYKYLPKDQVFGIKLISKADLASLSIPEKQLPKNVIEMAKILVKMLRTQALKIHVDEDDWERTIRVDVGTITATDFDISDEEKDFLIQQGVNGANKFFLEL